MRLLTAVPLLSAVGVLLAPFVAGGPPPSPSPHGLLLVANKGGQTVGLIDPASARQIATIKETGVTVHELAASPDGKTAYAPVYGDSGVGLPGTDGQTIDVIDIASRRVVSTIDLGRGLRPHCVQFGPADGLVYVSTELANAVTIIDPKTEKIIGTIPTGQSESHMFTFTPDGSRIYTSNVGPGTVSVLDVKARKVLDVIPVSKQAQRISISPDSRWVFTSDQTQPRLAVIDTGSNKLARWVDLPGTGYGTAPTPDGRFLLVAVIDKDKVAVVDLAAMKVVRTIDVPHSPQEVLIRPDGAVAYVSCSQTEKVAAINLETWKVDQEIGAGPGADGLAWAK